MAGEAARAFYHMNDHPHGFRYVRLADLPPEEAPESSDKKGLVVGLSTGWIPATVAEDWSPDGAVGAEDSRVLVRMHGRFADAYHPDPEPVQGMYWRIPRADVRRMGEPQAPAELSLVVLRWWDYWNPKNRGSRSHNVANEKMLLDVLEGPGSPHSAFAEQGSYEVHSAFIRSSADLTPAASALSASLRGRRCAGLYFLWPTQRPAVERRMPAAVSGPGLLDAMNSLESLGIRTCWPHPSPLYRQLAGKMWVARASRERPDLRVPPAVMLEYTQFQADPRGTAERAIEELRRLRMTTAPTATAESTGPLRGLVKLGFSWMGEDVRPFTGVDELEGVLRQMLDGASPGVVCLVQVRVEAVACELRLVSFRDLASGPEAVSWKLVRMRQKSSRHATADDQFTMASHETMTAAEAAKCAFGGDASLMEAAEAEVQRLGALWLKWFREEGYGTPGPAFRLDFLLSGGGGAVEGRIWTVELCECGGSLCGLDFAARTAACLNECLNAGGPVPGFPQALPLVAVIEEHKEPQGSRSIDRQGVLTVLSALKRRLPALVGLSAGRAAAWAIAYVLILSILRRLWRRSRAALRH